VAPGSAVLGLEAPHLVGPGSAELGWVGTGLAVPGWAATGWEVLARAELGLEEADPMVTAGWAAADWVVTGTAARGWAVPGWAAGARPASIQAATVSEGTGRQAEAPPGTGLQLQPGVMASRSWEGAGSEATGKEAPGWVAVARAEVERA